MSIGSPNLGSTVLWSTIYWWQIIYTSALYWSFIRSLLHTELRVEPCLDLNLYAADLQINPLNAELKGFAWSPIWIGCRGSVRPGQLIFMSDSQSTLMSEFSHLQPALGGPCWHASSHNCEYIERTLVFKRESKISKMCYSTRSCSSSVTKDPVLGKP